MEESKRKLKELEEWINAHNEPVDRVCVADIFHDLKSEIEYWMSMYNGQSEECEDLLKLKDKEIEHLKFVMRKYHKYASQDFAKRYGIEL